MPVKFMSFITRSFVKQHSDWYFVFGDNVKRQGYGGQAKEMRGELNAIGVRTKNSPTNEWDAFFNEIFSKQCIRLVKEDLDKVEALLNDGCIVVFPRNGLGTGRAQLKQKAPTVYEYLINRIQKFVEKYGGEIVT